MKPQASVLMISDRPEQMTGSGCCGKVKGDPSISGADRAFHEAAKIREEMGLLYRTVRQLFHREVEQGLVTLTIVDPRNQLYLVPKLWRDVLRYRPGWRDGLRTMFQIFSLPAIVVNGRALPNHEQITPDHLSQVLTHILKRNQE